MNKLATILLCVNFITVLFPQPGYIHPDEFFQSSEIVAGDILGVAHERAWEFNASLPVRSIVFPYLLTGPSLYFLRWINGTSFSGFKISAVKVTMATRLPIAFLSVTGYLATSKLAETFGTEKYLSSILWCSSYVSWTYFTRMFSNSVEACLLALLLLLLLPRFAGTKWKKNVLDSEKSVKQGVVDAKSRKSNEDTLDKNNPDTSAGRFDAKGARDGSRSKGMQTEKIQTSERRTLGIQTDGVKLNKDTHCWFKSFLIGFLVVSGFFNRPTFLIFAFVPCLYWFCEPRKRGSFTEMSSKLMLATSGALAAFLSFVLLDTLYYNPIFVSLLCDAFRNLMKADTYEHFRSDFMLAANSLSVTPWNFLQYNTNTKNLAQHGLHPRFTHFLINLPLLLGPMLVPFVVACFFIVFTLCNRYKSSGHHHRHDLWLLFMAFVPVAALSIFPHQEPRFLIPLMPVFIVLGTKLVSQMAHGKIPFLTSWAVFNIALTLVYGYLHQAALIPALSIYQQKLSSLSSRGITHTAIFYKTYPPPRHLLLLNPSSSKVRIHDLAGAPLDTLVQTVKASHRKCLASKSKCKVFAFLPSTVSPRVEGLLKDLEMSITNICPHFSSEAPPRFRAWWTKRLSFDEFVMDFCLNIIKI